MEQKNYKIIKNMLFPIKTEIIINEDFFQVGKKRINWKDIKGCSCHVQSVNKGMNYIIALDGVNGEKVYLNIVHNIAASKKKKEMFAEIYTLALQQIEKYHIKPIAEEMLGNLKRGDELSLEKIKLSTSGAEISKGVMKKEKQFIPIEDLDIQFYQGTGGFRIASKTNEKDFQHIPLSGIQSRYLLEIVNELVSKN